MDTADLIANLINRLARLDAAEAWSDGLNPAQIAALDYLAAANRFSRSPSHLADYLGATRGTVSQTLKSLQRKGLIEETRDPNDRRSISYTLTEAARPSRHPLATAAQVLSTPQGDGLRDGLEALLAGLIAQNRGKSFGVCHTCKHFRPKAPGGHCALLHVELLADETEQICHEQVPS